MRTRHNPKFAKARARAKRGQIIRLADTLAMEQRMRELVQQKRAEREERKGAESPCLQQHET